MTTSPTGTVPNLGEIVRRRRTRKKWSIPILAREAGVSVIFISRLELHDRCQHVDALRALANALGTTPGNLLVSAERETAKQQNNGSKARK